MSETTVRELAEAVGIPVDRVLALMGEAGLPHTEAGQGISEQEKARFTAHINLRQGKSDTPARPKISLKRKSVSEIKIASAQGRKKTVTVEVRKRRSASRSTLDRASTATDSPPEGDAGTRMNDAKRALQEEARRRQQDLDEHLRIESEERERQEKIAPKRKKKEPVPEPEADRVSAKSDEAVKSEPAPAEAVEKKIEKKEESSPSKKPAGARQAAPAKEKEKEKAKPKSKPKREAPATAKPSSAAKPAATESESRGRGRAKPAAGGRGEARHSERQDRSGRRGDRGRKSREELHVASDKAGYRRKRPKPRRSVQSAPTRHGFEMPTEPMVREVTIPETISVGELAQRMSLKAPELIRFLMTQGIVATTSQTIDQDTAVLVVGELGHVPKPVHESTIEEDIVQARGDIGQDIKSRPPVVTIMGHVDHGKTSLLDHIRTTRVAAGEAGGITQHIGAYRVESAQGSVTFLDTPGHAAFTAMRARGAQATDIVVLVVAADDGVMPQTIEAIAHAGDAKVPIVVAVNKIDKEDADPERIRKELSGHGVIPEPWGGENIFVDVSALDGRGIDELLEAIHLQAEVLELKAAIDGPARGVVIESRIERGRGPVATVLVQSGSLSRSDTLLAGQEFGRVRGLFDQSGREVKHAGPSMPVEVLGLSGPPKAGDEAVVVSDDRKAREIAERRQNRRRDLRLARRVTKLENVFEQMQEGQTSTINIIVKADVQGSVEAIVDALLQLSTDEIKVNIVAAAAGGISETDVNLSVASNATIIGFNVRADAAARRVIEDGTVDLKYFSVIYEVIDYMRQAMTGMLAPKFKETIVGLAEVRDIFRSRKFGDIAGCRVTEGLVRKDNPIRVLRDSVVIYEGELESLRRFQDDVAEVRAGTECGIGVRDYNDVKVGDQIEIYERVQVERTI
ncbi:translation initiation factor IF-2 [Thioalkalivibrio sp. HK1]|uniref:translation initiation factor IF-2 n=1 Tax=Thioalkalivibrio sp. HK1 TaxID=1469245 RepID=UPI00047240A3|nr:translation initiation factor IF-2 [Thioalkalivibrio sp. HK1]